MHMCYKLITQLGYWKQLTKKRLFEPKLTGINGLREYPKIWYLYFSNH